MVSNVVNDSKNNEGVASDVSSMGGNFSRFRILGLSANILGLVIILASISLTSILFLVYQAYKSKNAIEHQKIELSELNNIQNVITEFSDVKYWYTEIASSLSSEAAERSASHANKFIEKLNNIKSLDQNVRIKLIEDLDFIKINTEEALILYTFEDYEGGKKSMALARVHIQNVDSELNKLFHKAQSEAEVAAFFVEETTNSSYGGGFAMFALLLILTVIFVGALNNLILKPLSRITIEMKRLANGNTDITITDVNNENEIGDMARAVKLFCQNTIKINAMHKEREQARRERDMERALALSEAQEANIAKTQFLATMSHELRTPLNAIIGFSEVMTTRLFGSLGSNKYEEYAEDIFSSGRHLLDLVNDILDYSELESGEKDLQFQLLDIKSIINESLTIIARLAEDKKINCTVNLEDNINNIYADHRALKQIIINVLSNSVKYTDVGGFINFSIYQENQKHIFCIEDNGQGIPTDKLECITDPFTRADNDPLKTQTGTGLGLAIVQSLVNLHNGELKIESEVDVGTKTIITFPQ